MGKVDKIKIKPNLLSLAGEYRVCSELLKRGVFATVTYGTHKGVDVFAINDTQDRALRIEVKTSQTGLFVTSISQKDLKPNSVASPDFWVLFLLKSTATDFDEQFFVLTHAEIYELQNSVNREYAQSYRARRGVEFEIGKGVDNIPVRKLEGPAFKDQWQKIIQRLQTTGKQP